MKQDYSKAFELSKNQLVDIDSYNLANSNDLISFNCAICGEIKTCKKRTYVRSILTSINHKKYCSNKCHGKLFISSEIINCENCGFLIKKTKSELEKNNHHYCGSRCSAIASNKKRKESGFFHSLETKKKIKETLIKIRRNNQNFKNEIINGTRDPETGKKFFKNKCVFCNKDFMTTRPQKKLCSEVCYTEKRKITSSKAGIKTASLPFHIRNRSKNEKLFFNMIKEKFDDALSNPRIFNGFDADIVIPSLKLAIHWNGPWHYKQMFNTEKGKYQFEQIQIRDKQRLNEIEKYGYTNYIIKDMKKHNKIFVKNQFVLFINKFSVTQS